MTTPAFAATNSYLRHFNFRTRVFEYLFLADADGPILYPFRFPELAPGSEQAQPTVFDDLSPSKESSHLYQAFLGLYPGFWYKLWMPYNVRTLQLDERVDQVSEDVVSILRHRDSPVEDPQKSLWIDEQRWPAIQPRNVGAQLAHPGVEITLMKYLVTFNEDIDPTTREKLVVGEIPSTQINFGGEL